MDTKIKASFWTDPDVEGLAPHQRLAFLWMMTNSQLNLCGFFETSRKRFEFETGLPGEALWETVEALPRALKGFKDKNTIYVRHYIRHQLGSGEQLTRNNIFRSVQTAFQSIRHEELRSALLEDYPEIGSPSKPLLSPLKGKEKEKEKEQESGEEVQKEGDRRELLDWAERIRDAYPRSSNPMEVLPMILKSLAGDVNPEGVLEAVLECKAAMDSAPGGSANFGFPNSDKFFAREDWKRPAVFWARAKEKSSVGKKPHNGHTQL